MGIIVLIAFTALLIGAVIVANRHEKTEEAGDYNARVNERLDYIEKYIELVKSDHALGKISEEDYQHEMEMLLDELNGIRESIETCKEIYKCPEIEEMKRLTDDFFGKYGGNGHE